MLSTVEALEQIALQMAAVDRFPDHFLLLPVPHGIVQHLIQYPQRPQFPGSHIAQKGAVVAAVGPPVFLLPAAVAGGVVADILSVTCVSIKLRAPKSHRKNERKAEGESLSTFLFFVILGV